MFRIQNSSDASWLPKAKAFEIVLKKYDTLVKPYIESISDREKRKLPMSNYIPILRDKHQILASLNYLKWFVKEGDIVPDSGRGRPSMSFDELLSDCLEDDDDPEYWVLVIIQLVSFADRFATANPGFAIANPDFPRGQGRKRKTRRKRRSYKSRF